MKKVLLAIDGVSPDRKIFDYAVQFCGRIKAELNILQIIDPAVCRDYVNKARKGAGRARKYFENAMMAATFAEAGESRIAKEIMDEACGNINRLLPESEKAGVQCRLFMKVGDPGNEIVNYVNEHRDVVVAIYDAHTLAEETGAERHRAGGEENDGAKDFSAREMSAAGIMRRLAVPLVFGRPPFPRQGDQ